MDPVANVPLSAVELCVDVSLFVHVTVVPVATVIGLGEYAVVVSLLAPATIEIVTPGLGLGLGDEGLELLLLQAVIPTIVRTNRDRRKNISFLLVVRIARTLPLHDARKVAHSCREMFHRVSKS
jgi:hypothetical protein